jgi:hypothetical protein
MVFDTAKCYNLKEEGKKWLGDIYLGKYISSGNAQGINRSRNFEKPYGHYFEKRFVSAKDGDEYTETECKMGGAYKSQETPPFIQDSFIQDSFEAQVDCTVLYRI